MTKKISQPKNAKRDRSKTRSVKTRSARTGTTEPFVDYLQVQFLSPEEVFPYDANPRKHSTQQVARVAESIQRFGFNSPVVVDEKFVVIVGHCRLLAAKKLNLSQIPVVRLTTLSESEKRAYRIIDNKTASEASDERELLEQELRHLHENFEAFEEFGLDEYKFDFSGEEEQGVEEPEEEAPSEWAGIISLRVPAADVESFEAQLDELIRAFPRVIKEKEEVGVGRKKGKRQ